ncbi:MAG: helix-turn-helix domain-containing protein [Deltaproteobacteria bacterium]|nr:helix-turn-helix domain-containing protein [Deltaproteobacteria bacterium]
MANRLGDEFGREYSNDLEWEPWQPTPEDEARMMEQHLKEMEDKRDSTIIFDAGSREKMTVRQFEKFYGTEEFTDELINAAKAKEQYSKETAIAIKKRYQKLSKSKVIPIAQKTINVPQPEKPKVAKKEKEQFVPMRYGFIEKARDAKCHQNPTALLMVLLKHRTWPGKMDKHHTYTHWYKKKRKIVASRSVSALAEDLGVSEKSVRRFINELVKNGDIEKAKGFGKGYQRDNIYILGEVDENGNETLYCEQNK